MKLPITSIIIHERQRIDIGDINELCDSMKRLGQLQAVLVERQDNTFHLIDGFRRITAAKNLEWAEIECIEKIDLTDLQRQEMELEADTKRKDRTWQERCLAFLKLHKLKGFGDPTWSQEKLADILGKSVGHVNETLSVARTLERTKEQTDEWSTGLWQCLTFHNACQYIALRCETAFYNEILKRQKARDLATGMEKPSSSEIQSVNLTKELFQIPARKIQWNKRMPEQNECRACLIFSNGTEELLSPLSLLAPNSAALIWLMTRKNPLENARSFTQTYKLLENSYRLVNNPLVWNTIEGTKYTEIPVQLSYHFGLFVMGKEWKPYYQTPKQSVFSEHQNDEMEEIPAKAVLTMLDYISQEGDKIWLPYGGPIIDVYRAGRTPIWYGGDDEKVKAEFMEQFGKVEFICH